MATGQGTATLNFGTVGGKGLNSTGVAVTGQASILGTSKAEAYFMGDSTTATHTANDHRQADMFIDLTCGTPVAATGFTLYGTSMQKLSGTFLVNWVWAD